MRDMRTMIGIRDHLERFPPDDWMNATGTRWFVMRGGRRRALVDRNNRLLGPLHQATNTLSAQFCTRLYLPLPSILPFMMWCEGFLQSGLSRAPPHSSNAMGK
jgi:hypothetical protein